MMSTLEEIQAAVVQLKAEDRARFRRWFLEREADSWDREIEADARAGKLEFLAEEALRNHRSGKSRKL
jgi:uncharacterized protein YfaT (DUF1175 family)